MRRLEALVKKCGVKATAGDDGQGRCSVCAELDNRAEELFLVQGSSSPLILQAAFRGGNLGRGWVGGTRKTAPTRRPYPEQVRNFSPADIPSFCIMKEIFFSIN